MSLSESSMFASKKICRKWLPTSLRQIIFNHTDNVDWRLGSNNACVVKTCLIMRVYECIRVWLHDTQVKQSMTKISFIKIRFEAISHRRMLKRRSCVVDVCTLSLVCSCSIPSLSDLRFQCIRCDHLPAHALHSGSEFQSTYIGRCTCFSSTIFSLQNNNYRLA